MVCLAYAKRAMLTVLQLPYCVRIYFVAFLTVSLRVLSSGV